MFKNLEIQDIEDILNDREGPRDDINILPSSQGNQDNLLVDERLDKIKTSSSEDDPLLLEDDVDVELADDLQFMDFEEQLKIYDQMQSENQDSDYPRGTIESFDNEHVLAGNH